MAYINRESDGLNAITNLILFFYNRPVEPKPFLIMDFGILQIFIPIKTAIYIATAAIAKI